MFEKDVFLNDRHRAKPENKRDTLSSSVVFIYDCNV